MIGLTFAANPLVNISQMGICFTGHTIVVKKSKMATGEPQDSDALSSNPIFQDISGSIAQILRGVGCKSKADIVEQLISHIDGSELQEC